MLRRAGVPAGEVADLVQEVFLSTLRFAEGHPTPPAHLDAFLHWRARGVVTEFRRAERRGAREELLPALAATGASVRPEARLLEKELLELVERSVRRWLPRTRRIWELRYGSLASVKEIASRQGLNARTVATILFRARTRLLEDLCAGGFAVRCA